MERQPTDPMSDVFGIHYYLRRPGAYVYTGRNLSHHSVYVGASVKDKWTDITIDLRAFGKMLYVNLRLHEMRACAPAPASGTEGT